MLLLLDFGPWRYWNHKSQFVTPALIVLAEHRNILWCKVNLMDIIVDDVLPVAVSLSPVCKWQAKLVDDFVKAVIIETENMLLSVGVEDVRLASPSVELLVGHKVRPVSPLNCL